MWYKIHGDCVTLKILAKPNAKRSALLAISEQGLQIALHAKPHQGEANTELVAFLAEFFRIPKSKITLLRGSSGRHKLVELPLNEKLKQMIAES